MNTVVRPRSVTRVVCSALPALAGLALAFGGVVDTTLGTWLRVGAVVLALILIAVGVRTWQMAVVMTEQGATVVNLLRTHHFKWPEIERFVFDGGVSVRLVGGRETPITAFAYNPRALPFVQRHAATACKDMENRRRVAQRR